MTQCTNITKCREAGFTLVELAVVMIIIGLLIGGVLKGQELINNAQMTATTSDLQGFEAATSTFVDIYDTFPGDVPNATARVPNCAACPSGDGNGRLATGTTAVDPIGAATGEGLGYYQHLAGADLIAGIDQGGSATAGVGDTNPELSIRGAVARAGFSPGSAAAASIAGIAGNGIRQGHYISVGDIALGAAISGGLTPVQAQKIDSKLDDGNAGEGIVRAVNATATCTATASGVIDYNAAQANDVCGVVYRIQN